MGIKNNVQFIYTKITSLKIVNKKRAFVTKNVNFDKRKFKFSFVKTENGI